MNKKMRRFGGYLKRAIVFMIMFSLMIADMGVCQIEAAQFSYKWIGSASSSGSFKFSDGSSDSAGYGYSIEGIGKVFCINQGSEIYNNDNYTSKGVAKFSSEGKSDFSYDAVVAKIAYYWVNNKSDDFARSLVQALIWQAVDKGYTSKSALKNIIKQSKATDADKLFEEIFEVDDELEAVVTTYKSSNYGSTQRMASLSANVVIDNTEFGYATYKRSMTYRQIVSLHKIDTDNKPIAEVVYAVKLSDGLNNLVSLSMQKGTLLKAVNASDLSKGYTEVLEMDALGNATGTKVTKSIDQIKDMYPGDVLYVKTDSNGDVRFRLAYKTESKVYAYGKYKKDNKWIYVNTYEQMEKLSDNTDSSVMKDGHTYYYWMKKAHDEAGDGSGWTGFKDRAKSNSHGKYRMDSSGKILSDTKSDLRNAYESVSSYIGISEVAGKNGNTYYDNTLSINPVIDGNYKWINITKDDSSISNMDGVSEANKKNVTYLKIGTYKNKDGGTYTNSDFVRASDNTWLSIPNQEDNENTYSVDEARVTSIKLNNKDGIVNAYYRYGVDSLSENRKYNREFKIHKIDEDGEVISNAKFEFKIDLGETAGELVCVYVNDEPMDYKLEDSNLSVDTLTDINGDIKINLEFEKRYENYSYGYGKYFDYSQFKYVDIKDENTYKGLNASIKSGVSDVVKAAYGKKAFSYYNEKAFDYEGGKAKAREAIDKDFGEFLKTFAEEKISAWIKEVEVVGKDYYAVNSEYANGKTCELGDKDTLEIVDNHKSFSVAIFKTAPDGIRKLDGAVFEIYEDSEFKVPARFYDKDGKLINDNGKALSYVTVDGKLVTDYLRCRVDDYYLKEVKAPVGYVSIYDDSDKNNDVIKIKCDGSTIDDIEYKVDEAVKVDVKNAGTKIRFEKRDKDTGKLISGAKIEVRDKDGNLILSFKSAVEGNVFDGLLKAGEEYTFHESKAPKGYDEAEDVKVVVKATDEEQIVTMYDERISIVKTSERDKDREKNEEGGGSHIITPKTGVFIDEYKAEDANLISKMDCSYAGAGLLFILAFFMLAKKKAKE